MTFIPAVVQMLMQLVDCSRRKQKLVATAHGSNVKLPMPSDKSWEIREPSEPSTEDVSDHSGPTESSTGDALAESLSCGSGDSDMGIETSSFAPPPGLDAPPPGLAQPWTRRAQHSNSRAEAPWNTRAVLSVPKPQHGGTEQSRMSTDNLTALKEALDRLDPAEMATVKVLLDSTMRDAGMSNDSKQQCEGAATALARKMSANLSQKNKLSGTFHRPCTPFQGGQTPVSRPVLRSSSYLNRPQPAKTSPQGATESNRYPIQAQDSMATILKDLSLLDNGRVITLRKISRLGLNSTGVLQTHMAQFGSVQRVYAADTQSKCSKTSKIRVRPPVVGFVVMSTAEDAAAALKHGSTHVVAGVEIVVGGFQSHSIDES